MTTEADEKPLEKMTRAELIERAHALEQLNHTLLVQTQEDPMHSEDYYNGDVTPAPTVQLVLRLTQALQESQQRCLAEGRPPAFANVSDGEWRALADLVGEETADDVARRC